MIGKVVRKFRTPSVGTVLGGAAVVIALGGVATAAIPSANGVIDACYRTSGDLRVIDAEAGATCRAGETAISWNQAGSPGTVGAHHVFSLGELDSIDRKEQVVMCPAGEVATGGGFNLGIVSDIGPSVAVQQSLPVVEEGKPVGWRVEAAEVVPTTEDWRLVATAVCAPGS